MSASGDFVERKVLAAPEAAGGRAPSDNKHLVLSPEAAEEAVWAARAMLVEVFKRAHTCSRPQCRRKGTCLAGWDSPVAGRNPLYDPTGGCPVMNEAEWEVVQLGVIRQRMLAMELLKAMDDAEENGCMPPSMAAKPGKKTPDRKLRWVEWLAFDPVAQLKELDRESARILAAKGVVGKVGRRRR